MTQTRLSQLDGVGLTDPSVAEIPKLKAEIAGLKETLSQVSLLLETELNDAKAKIEALEQIVAAHLAQV